MNHVNVPKRLEQFGTTEARLEINPTVLNGMEATKIHKKRGAIGCEQANSLIIIVGCSKLFVNSHCS